MSKKGNGLITNNSNGRAGRHKQNLQPDTSNCGEKQSRGLHYNVTLLWRMAKQEHRRHQNQKMDRGLCCQLNLCFCDNAPVPSEVAIHLEGGIDRTLTCCMGYMQCSMLPAAAAVLIASAPLLLPGCCFMTTSLPAQLHR
jgi:hypothetical protein